MRGLCDRDIFCSWHKNYMLIAEDIFYVHERETGYNKNALKYCSATQVPEIYQRVNNSAEIEPSKKISVNVLEQDIMKQCIIGSM
jgi:hypothetical protein